jgi:hypothetical protein
MRELDRKKERERESLIGREKAEKKVERDTGREKV